MKRIISLLVLLTWAQLATAEPLPWMKQDNPDNLGLILRVGSGCPETLDEYSKLIQGIFVRSRLPRTDQFDGLNLYADLQCTGVVVDGLHAFSLDVHFARVTDDGLMLYGATNYGRLGLADKEAISDEVRDTSEAAITDYLKANFDL